MFIENFKSFFAKPFSQDMSATNWFLFLGFVIIVMVMWRIILAHIFYEMGALGK